MAKRLLLNILVDAFGDFIEGLNADNLQIGVFSGQIILEDLKINPVALNRLKLPVEIVHGYIGEFKLNIPWTKLTSEAVTVEINHVYCSVKPSFEVEDDEEKLKQILLDSKRKIIEETCIRLTRARLEALEENDNKNKNKNKEQQQSYGFIEKIVDNLYIKLNDIHFRYEDDFSSRGKYISAGIILDGLEIATTDKDGRITFVNKDDEIKKSKKNKNHEIYPLKHKQISIDGFQVYWNHNAMAKDYHMNERSLQEFISVFKLKTLTIDPMTYIINPLSMVIKGIHNPELNGKYPFQFRIFREEDDTIDIGFHVEQYEQLLLVKDTFDSVQTKQKLIDIRPRQSVMENPKAWWKYAYVCVIGKPVPTSFLEVLNISKKRNKYLELYRKVKKHQLTLKPDEKIDLTIYDPLSKENEERRDFDQIELEVPVNTLIVWRIFVEEELAVFEKKKSEQKKNTSWNPFASKKKVEVVEDDDIDVDDLMSSALSLIETTALLKDIPDEFDMAIGNIVTGFNLILYTYHNQPLIQMMCNYEINFSYKDIKTRVDFTASNFVIHDRSNASSFWPMILNTTANDNDNEIFKLEATMTPNLTEVNLITQPFHVVFNNKLITKVGKVFTTPKDLQDKIALGALDKAAKAKAAAEAKLSQAKIRVNLDIAAPNIYIPKSFVNDEDILILVPGTLKVDGGIGLDNQPGHTQFNIILKDSQVRLPSSKALISVPSIDNDDKLLEPFDLNLDLNMINPNVYDKKKDQSDLDVETTITPGIKGVLSPGNITILLAILNATFSTDDKDIDDSVQQMRKMTIEDGAENDTDDIRVVIDLQEEKLVADELLISTGKTNQDDEKEKEEIDPLYLIMKVKAKIHAISFEMRSDTKESLFNLSLNHLSFEMIKRPYHSTMEVGLISVLMKNFMRPLDSPYQYMISTKTEEESKFLSMKMENILDKKSPIYNEFDSEIRMCLGAITFNMDADSILPLKPFYVALVNKGESDRVKNNLLLDAEKDTDGNIYDDMPELIGDVQMKIIDVTDSQFEQEKAVNASPKKSMHVNVILQSISAELLTFNNGILEPVVSAALSGFTSEVKMTELMDIDFELKSFDVIDSRISSRKNAIRKLICPKKDLLDEDMVVPLMRGELTEKSPGDKSIDIILENFTCNLITNALLAFADVSLSILDSAMQVISVVSDKRKDSTTTMENGIEEKERKKDEKNKTTATEDSFIEINLKILNPGLILVENPMIEDTLAVATRGNFSIHYIKSAKKSSIVNESVHLSVEDFQSFVRSALPDSKTIPIIKPFTLDVYVKRNIEANIVLSFTANVSITKIITRVAYNDIILVMSILNNLATVNDLIEDNQVVSELKENNADTKEGIEDNVEVELRPALAQKVTFMLYMAGIDIEAINDFAGQELPVLSFNLGEVHSDLQIVGHSYHGDARFQMSSSFFNVDVFQWEPLLEPWSADIEVRTEDDDAAAVSIICQKPLNITVSSTFLSSIFATIIQLFKSTTDLNEKLNSLGKKHPYTLVNKTGIEISLCTGAISYRIPEQGKKSFSFDDITDTEGMMAMDDHDLLEKEKLEKLAATLTKYGQKRSLISLKMLGPLEGQREVISQLDTDLSLKKTIPIKPIIASNKIYPAPVIDEVFQNQRFDVLTQRWKKPFMPTDIHEYTNYNNEETPRESFTLPSSEWRWITTWEVDHSEDDTDNDGWEYDYDFWKFISNRKKNPVPLSTDNCRRRRMIRIRTMKQPDFDDPCRPLFLLFETEMQPGGESLLIARSPIQFENNTDKHIEIKLQPDLDMEGIVIGSVEAYSSFVVPLLLAHCFFFQIRVDGNDEWSPLMRLLRTKTPEFKFLQKNKLIVNARPMPDGETVITIDNPVSVSNFLPCELQIGLLAVDSSTDLVQTQAKRQTLHTLMSQRASRPVKSIEILPGKTVPFYEDTKIDLLFTIKLPGCDWSFPVQVKLLKKPVVYTFQFNEDNVSANVKVYRVARRIFKLEIFSSYWIIDRTGLGLRFTESTSSAGRRSKIKGDPQVQQEFEALYLPLMDVKSKREYNVMMVDTNHCIYSDRDYKWTSLPPKFRRKMYIQTPNNDKRAHDANMLEFSVSVRSIIYVLYDVGPKGDPRSNWLTESGFTLDEDSKSVINTHSRKDGKLYFESYWKIFGANSVIKLNGNMYNSNNEYQNNMYTVFILRAMDGMEELVEKSMRTSSEDDMMTEEPMGFLLFNSVKQKVHMRVGENRRWSKELRLNDYVRKSKFTIENTKTSSFDVCASLEMVPGVFSMTQILKVTPFYCIVNCLEDDLVIKQADTAIHRVVKANGRCPFYFAKKDSPKHIQFMVAGKTAWSRGSMNIDKFDSTAMSINLETAPKFNEDGSYSTPPLILNIDIQTATSKEDCAIVVVVTKAKLTDNAHYRIENDSAEKVFIYQENSIYPKFRVNPGESILFGWENVGATPRCVCVEIESYGKNPKKLISLDEVNEPKAIALPTSKHTTSKTLFIGLLPVAGTKVLKIGSKKDDLLFLYPESIMKMSVHINLPHFGISLIDNGLTDLRREIIYISAENIIINYTTGTVLTDLEVIVNHFQIDNHIANALYPVLFCPAIERDMNDPESLPYFYFSVVLQKDSTSNYSSIRYMGLRVLQSEISIDLESLFALSSFASKVDALDEDEFNAENDPCKWVNQFREFLNYADPFCWVDIEGLKTAIAAPRSYFEGIIIHPIFLSLTFTGIQTTRENKATKMNGLVNLILTLVGDLNSTPLNFNSFAAQHVMRSGSGLAKLFITFYSSNIKNMILPLIGSSLTVIDVTGFVSNVGTGVKSFIYEPASGAMSSPKDFAYGLKKGTTDLVKNIIGGALLGTAATTLNKGGNIVSTLTFDDDYQAKRYKERVKNQNNNMGEGFKTAGNSVGKGLKDGISGVFTAPIKGAQKDGLFGFGKGLAKGLVGVALKPAVGILDGVGSVIQGVSNSTQDIEIHSIRRPRRALPKIPFVQKKVVTPYNEIAAKIQATQSEKNGYICHYFLDNELVMITTQQLMLHNLNNDSNQSKSKMRWNQLSHVEITADGLRLIKYQEADQVLACSNRRTCFELYQQLFAMRKKMGNPAKVVLLEEVILQEDSKILSSTGSEEAEGKSKEHKFGSVNNQKVNYERIRKTAIIANVAEKLKEGSFSMFDLDLFAWQTLQLICLNNQNKVNSWRKVIVALVINRSDTGVQILHERVHDALDYHNVPGSRFDRDANIILPGGYNMIVTWGHHPNPLKKGHVDFEIETSAFAARLSDMKPRCKCLTKPGFVSGFAELSYSEQWVKSVILIENSKT